ncbi:triose-phosphate isomerase [Candidatus Chloroploca sp. M-50]|uniref:Triosephosphate isomerase n=1 Tax=Candidatus Chloroploca mongolica TaxID=2528176 RepID=A0ABS4D5Y5_9CHLR|nr:triose-phosphate isomerase [Candidatus Chloroploca mongolica]MBP1464854.1 triose-phosphate isomerase [Candidatus Chloroploca mongolica]NCC30926.1 triose-phosphate isomerase [Chloroflexia bacterium]
MRTPIIAGNWKMFKTVGEAVELVKALLAEVSSLEGREVVICPPFTTLYALRPLLVGTRLGLGGQNVYHETQGAYTGEIAPGMLVDVGCQYVILGHSERRQYFGETDASVNRKLRAALTAGLTPIVCVGETKTERDAGQAEAVVGSQIQGSLAGLTPTEMAKCIVAYEPVWAIGTGDTATPEDAQAMHAAIRAMLADQFGGETASGVRIQYGGSVKPDNIDVLMSQADIDGALVGGASLTASSFLRIVKYQ